MRVIKFEAGLKPVFKHAEHDQSSHGNWATGGVVTSNEDAYAMQLDYIKKLGVSANTGTLISGLKNSVSERIEKRMSDVSTEDLANAAGMAFDRDKLVMGIGVSDTWRTRTALTPSETHPDSFAYVWNYDGSIEFARSFTEIPAEYRDKAAQRGTPEAETLVREVAVSKLVGYWATTSNDNNYISLSIQKAAAEVFNIDDYAPWNDNVEPTAREMKVYKAFVSAQYDETQKMLKEQGVQAVELWRGMAANLDHTDKTSVERTMQMRPLSSWSSFKDIAYEFATERYTGGPQVPVVMRAVIPAAKILATPVTGVGCWGEREFVVLGGPVKTDAWNADVTRDFTVTSAVNKAVTPVIVENSDEIADWIKWRTWDLPTDPKLYSDEELVQLMKLPVWNAAPPAIRDAARLRLPMQKQALEPHVCLGRANIVQKHQAGLHDQATHGNWAGDRYPADSVPTARDGALEYAFKVGLKYDKSIDYTKVKADRERAARIADLYEKLPSSDPEAFDEYDALKSEIDEQFKYMTENLGVKVEFTDDDPYPNSKAMFDDVSQGTLKVLKTTSTSPHPYLTNDENDKFRAVHDYFGHAATGRGFGQDGEEAAWVHHSQMFTMKARGALTTETRGQNSFFNNRGKTFAEQKVALLPEEFWRVPAFAKALRIAFAAGLKPILKHLPGQHDQATHGSWAGYSAEESARIEALKDIGPSAADMVRIITGTNDSMVTTEELFDFVSNNEAYIKDAFEIYEGEFDVSLDEMTDEQKEEAIARYVDNERTSLEVIYQENTPSESQTEASQMVPFFSEVYDISYTGTNRAGEEVNLYAETQDVYKDGENLKVEGNIYDRATGDKVGAFERRFFVKDGQLNVEHQYFEIYRDELKGTGFGKEFIQRSEDWYVSRGMGHILVGTAWEGARHWARAGYDFHPPTIMQNIGQLFEKVSWSEDFAEGTPARNDFDNLMRRMVTNYRYTGSDYPEFDNVQDMRNLDFPTPNDFAMIGYEPNRTYWEGRALMQDNHMTYMKVLTAEGRSILAGPIDRDGDGLVYDGTARERPAAADMPQGSVG